jgi:hypothetical protein
MRDAKINFELAADQCTPNDIQAWMDVLEAGAALGTIKLEVLSSDLHFQNLWLSIQEREAPNQA